MKQTEYKIDENLIKKISEDNRVAKLILIEYLDKLAKNPANKTNQDFHKHFATRLIRAIEDKPCDKDDIN
jgi:hypothetical protein